MYEKQRSIIHVHVHVHVTSTMTLVWGKKSVEVNYSLTRPSN